MLKLMTKLMFKSFRSRYTEGIQLQYFQENTGIMDGKYLGTN